jgi:hypothetical protein
MHCVCIGKINDLSFFSSFFFLLRGHAAICAGKNLHYFNPAPALAEPRGCQAGFEPGAAVRSTNDIRIALRN